MSEGLAIPFNSSRIAIPTMDVMITPTITMRAEMRRNRRLLKWSPISFLNIVKIPYNLGLLKVLHIDLFKRIVFLAQSQLFLRQFLNGTDRHQIPIDHNPHPVTDLLNLIEQMGGKKESDILFPAQGMDEVEHPIRSIGIEADRGLIEEDEFRLLDQYLCDPESLSHSFRIGAHLFC